MRNSGLPSQCKWDLRSSGMLRSVVSGKPVGPSTPGCLTLDDRSDRKVGNNLPIYTASHLNRAKFYCRFFTFIYKRKISVIILYVCTLYCYLCSALKYVTVSCLMQVCNGKLSYAGL